MSDRKVKAEAKVGHYSGGELLVFGKKGNSRTVLRSTFPEAQRTKLLESGRTLTESIQAVDFACL